MLKVWNVLLVVLAFCLALFGTFLTRSGIVSSIHSFTQSPLGPWFLGFICLIVAGLRVALDRARACRCCARRRGMESLVSREATFLYNNLLLVALCLTILWGVVFPILSEAVRGEQITVGAPYYNFFLRVFGLPLLLLMGDRPARRVAESVAALAGPELRLAGGDRARRRGRPAPARRGLVVGRARRVHVLRFRAGLDRLRVRARDARAAGADGRLVAGGVRGARRAEPAALRRLRRPCLDRPARDRRRRAPAPTTRCGSRCSAPGRRWPSAAMTSRIGDWLERDGAERDRDPGRRRRPKGRRLPRDARGRKEPLPRGGPGLERGRDPQRLPDRRGPVRDHRPDQRRTASVVFKVLVKPLVNLIWLAGLVFLDRLADRPVAERAEQRRLAARYRELRALARA